MQPWNGRFTTVTRRHSEPKRVTDSPKEGRRDALGRNATFLEETSLDLDEIDPHLDTNPNSERVDPNSDITNPDLDIINPNLERHYPNTEGNSPNLETPNSFNQWFNTLVLENKGSVARDHLANERTYLAWVRTSLMMMTLALAFLQMYSVQVRAKEALYNGHKVEIPSGPEITFLRQLGRPLGVLAGVVSILVVFSGLYRYFSVQKALCSDTFPASRFLVTGLVVCCVLVMIIILVVDSKTF